MKKERITFLTKVLTFMFVFAATFANAQSFEWAHGLGSLLDDEAKSVTMDAAGNVYIAGTFKETIDFDPGTDVLNLSSNGQTDIYIQKFDPSGNLIWAKSFGNTYNDIVGKITLDVNNNIYITGTFRKSIDLDPGTGVDMHSAVKSSDIFIQKLNENGEYVWGKTMGSTYPDEGIAIATDPMGNVYFTGSFRKAMDADMGAGSFILNPASKSKDVFIEKVNADGEFQWATKIGGTGNDVSNGIEVDKDGNVYTIGSFVGTVDFDPSDANTVIRTGVQSDVFIQKLNTNGEFVWVNAILGDGINTGSAVKVDANGNVFAVGSFIGSADFDPNEATSHDVSSNGNADGFIQKIDADGNFLWAQAIGASENDFINDLYIDHSNSLFITGGFSGTFQIGQNTTMIANGSNAGVNNTDAFIAKYGNDGVFKIAKYWGGILNDEGKSIHVDINSNIYTVGYFNLDVTLNPNNGIIKTTNAGGKDAFVQKLKYCVAADVPAFSSSSITVCEGENVNLKIISGNLNSATKWNWAEGSCDSQSIGEGTEVTVTPNSSTTYFVAAMGGCIQNPVCQEVTIIVNPKFTIEKNNNVCYGTEYTFEDGTSAVIVKDTTYTQALQAMTGCDSTITTNVTVTEINAMVEATSTSITATETDTEATFQWFNCETQAIIEGATEATFEPEVTGSYAVTINKNGCTETSTCTEIEITVSTNEPAWKKAISVRPNPVSTDLNINFGEAITGTIALMNITGKTIYSHQVVATSNLNIDVANLNTGIYFLQIIKDGSTATFKIMK